LPGDGYTTTTVYELAATGSAEIRMTMDGWATRLYRLR
jgi:hypothetical protein